MGDPGEGASLGLAGAAVDPPADLVGAEELEPVAEVEVENTRRNNRRWFEANLMIYLRRSWPGVVGLKAYKAERIIRKRNPYFYCPVVLETKVLTLDSRMTRVRLIVDRSNHIVRTTRVGLL